MARHPTGQLNGEPDTSKHCNIKLLIPIAVLPHTHIHIHLTDMLIFRLNKGGKLSI